MTPTAQELLRTTTALLAADPAANPLVPRIADGRARLRTVAVLALEQCHVIPADRRSFRHLAQRSTEAKDPESAAFFEALADGESLAEERLAPLLDACAVDEAERLTYEPQAGCQAYPAYVAWLALNGEPVDVVLALTANFASWGRCCAAIARALRERHGFSGEACGFFDLFAEPAPDLDRQALTAVQAGLDRGSVTAAHLHHGRLVQSYEAMFWETLAHADETAGDR
ncbi:transcriptional regulator [Streptomyces luteocolor]|uniref:transcriptional regulator n=1 Tax=Streptomyces luteocolor TaxID=285500 RepID=UPI000853B6FB|nr:transcriptional regulator [Streptomyces luteocolor]